MSNDEFLGRAINDPTAWSVATGIMIFVVCYKGFQLMMDLFRAIIRVHTATKRKFKWL